jgi:hypothetical protein
LFSCHLFCQPFFVNHKEAKTCFPLKWIIWVILSCTEGWGKDVCLVPVYGWFCPVPRVGVRMSVWYQVNWMKCTDMHFHASESS